MAEKLRPPTTLDVVVGVDGSPASAQALSYACAESRRTGGHVRVVHVLPEYEAIGSPFIVPDAELRQAGLAVVDSTLRQAGVSADDVEIVLRRGPRVPTLNAIARHAAVLVVGADRHSVAVRLLTGNVTTAVAATCAAPVVVVPETWKAGADVSGPVLVGVKNATHARELIGEGFAVAADRGTRLGLLHAWHLPSGYDDVIADRVNAAEWEGRARAEIETLVADWRGAFPSVPVDVEVRHDQPAHALAEATNESSELVLVRRAHGIPAALHLGSTARAVLRAAHCPVRIVPPGHVVEVPDLVLEEAGSAVK